MEECLWCHGFLLNDELNDSLYTSLISSSVKYTSIGLQTTFNLKFLDNRHYVSWNKSLELVSNFLIWKA